MIPNQLATQKFVLLKDKNTPLQKFYTTINNHELNSDIFQEFLKRGNKVYGVLCGVNNLIVLDFDNREVQEQLLPHLPKTFSVTSANKKLLHLYYYTDNTAPRKFDSVVSDGEKPSRILDIQGTGKYVVGPNSRLPSGKTYEIYTDEPIATLYGADLNEILKKISIPFKEIVKESKQYNTELDMFLDQDVVKIKKELTISKLLQRFDIPIYKNPTKCPLGHTSEGEKCFSFDDNKSGGVWHCFHCGESGDIITLYQKLYGHSNFMITKNKLFKELFIQEEEFDRAMKELKVSIENRKHPCINQLDIDIIAEKMINRYLFITTQETDKIYYYDKHKGIYINFGEYEIQKELEKTFTHFMKTSVCNEIINKIKRLTHRSITIFDQHKNLICLKNGVFNFETKLLLPHSPEYYFINSIPVTYNHLSECPKVNKFINDIYPQNPNLLFEICTFLLLKHNRHEKAIILVGSGSNGKSVYLSLAKSLVGENNVSVKSLQVLSEDKFATSSLFGKMANISADIPSKRLVSSDIFKTLVSGKDLVDAQFKGENSFKFINTAKLLFSCNSLPSTNDQTDGYLRKWCILQFNQKFEGANDNKFLLEEITTEDEISGLFNECIKRFDKVNIKGLDFADTVDEIRELYNNLSDPVSTFIEENCVNNQLGQLSFSEFADRYNVWLENKGIVRQSSIMIGKTLRNKNIRCSKINIEFEGKKTTQNVIYGFSWINENNNGDVINLC